MNKLIVLCLLAVVAAVVLAEAPQERIYCGRDLADTVAWLCDWGRTNKRSGSEPWWRLATTRGKRGGIATECCDKPCSLDEMYTYC